VCFTHRVLSVSNKKERSSSSKRINKQSKPTLFSLILGFLQEKKIRKKISALNAIAKGPGPANLTIVRSGQRTLHCFCQLILGCLFSRQPQVRFRNSGFFSHLEEVFSTVPSIFFLGALPKAFCKS
jgi:hypothetical protein